MYITSSIYNFPIKKQKILKDILKKIAEKEKVELKLNKPSHWK